MRKGVIAFFVVAVLVFGLVVMTLPQIAENNTQTVVKQKISPEDKDVQAMFLKIHNVQYVASGTPQTVAQFWTNGYGDCDDMARAFADYLESRGEKVYLGKITHESGGYSHTYVIWNGKIYDPTSIDPSGDEMAYYGVDEERFMKTFRGLGFTGMKSEEPYVKLTPEMCQMMSR